MYRANANWKVEWGSAACSLGTFLILVLLWSQCLVVMAMLSSTLYSRSLTSYAGNALTILVPAIACFTWSQSPVV